jgi:DNA replication protein DnaC
VGALTQHQATMLYRLVDARYSKGVPTICTVNVASDAEADERMGAATWDRLCHDAWKFNCNWPTYRKPAREIN